MIRNTFCFLEGIGLRTEENIWKQGIDDWNAFIESKRVKGISQKRKFYYDNRLKEAKRALADNDSKHFMRMPSTEMWRLYDWFSDETAYIDIETGYSNTRTHTSITAMTVYDGERTKTFVEGFNMHRRSISDALQRYKLIVTYNGSTFDLPVMKRHFALAQSVPNFDLRYACSRLGLDGGLKQAERQMGIGRDMQTEKNESNASYLWKMWRSTRNQDYLKQLVDYNETDAINLRPLAERTCSLLSSMMKEKMMKQS